MKKIGISTFQMQQKYGDKRALEMAKATGVDAVDFNLLTGRYNCRDKSSLYGKGDEAVVEYFTEIKRYADELGLEICQTHGQIVGFKNIKDEDDALVENARLDLLATKTLGCDICVMHTTTTLYMGPDAPRELMHHLNFDMFTRILPYAKQYGVRVATETFGDAANFKCVDFFGDINEFLIGYNKVKCVNDNADWFGICVDTGHSNKAARFGNPSAADVIRMCGKDIIALHLNDNDGLTDQHKTPATGNIDWTDVFSALEEVGFNGVYNLELNLTHFGKNFEQEEAEFAVKATRKLLADFEERKIRENR